MPEPVLTPEQLKANTIKNNTANYGAPATVDTTTDPNAGLLKTIQDSLLSTSGIISSQGNSADNVFKSAIDTINTNRDTSNTKLQSEFERNAGYLGDNANQDMINGRAAGAGGIMNLGAYKALVDSTDKSLKDLAQRKEELVLSNNVAAADKVSELMLKQLEFKQDASQKFFSNLLGLGNFTMSVKNNADNATKNITTLISDNPQAGILATDTPEQAAAKIAKNPNSPDALLKKAQYDNILSEIKNRNNGVGGTEAERTANTLASYAGAFVPGKALSDGTPTIDTNGFATPKAFKAAIGEAKVGRKDFITQFGYLLFRDKDGNVDKSYGLTPQEEKLVNGS